MELVHCTDDEDTAQQGRMRNRSSVRAETPATPGKGSGMRISKSLKQEASATVKRQRVHIGLSARMRIALLELHERILEGDYDPVRMMRMAREEKSSETQLRFRYGYGLYQQHVDRMIEIVERDLQVAGPCWEEEMGPIYGGDIQRAALITIVHGNDVF